MRRSLSLLLLAIWFSSRLAIGAACCVGGNPKSFITLARLQTYEVGLSWAFRDVYGEYDLYGDLTEASRNQTLSAVLGAGVRLSTDLQASLTLPLVYQTNKFGRDATTRAGLGDAIVAAQYTLLESLFQDDWFPTINLTGGVKLPTGKEESSAAGIRSPGTGTGWWEPFAGIVLQKTYGSVVLGVRAGYSARLAHGTIDKGDAIELIESISYLFSEQLSAAVGSTQTWTFDDKVDGGTRADSATRVASVFLSPTYFVNRYWSIAAGVDVSLPVDRAGVNQQASRSFSLTTKYGFY